jgi:hypothetical protein
MEKFKAGLHKKISSIFDGVPMQQNDGDSQPAHTSIPAFVREQNDLPRRADGTAGEVCAKPVISSPASPSVPKHQQSSQPANAPLPKRPMPDSIVKPSKQIPLQQIWQRISGKLFAAKPGVDANRQKVMVVLIPVLFIGLIIVLIRVLSGPAPKAAVAQSVSVADAVSASADKVDWQIPKPYPANLRDPMQRGSGLSVTGAQDGELAVKGILYSQDKPSAVVGSQIVHQGEKVSGVTVQKINKDSVEFELDGKKWIQQIQK